MVTCQLFVQWSTGHKDDIPAYGYISNLEWHRVTWDVVILVPGVTLYRPEII